MAPDYHGGARVAAMLPSVALQMAAVAAGMVLEARLGENVGVTAAGTAETIARAVAALGIEEAIAVPGGAARVLSFLGADKKSRSARPRFVLLRNVGAVHAQGGWSHEVPMPEVERVTAGGVVDPLVDG